MEQDLDPIRKWLVTLITFAPPSHRRSYLVRPVLVASQMAGTVGLLFSSSSRHSTFQRHQSQPIGMKVPGEYPRDFSMFGDSNVQCL